MDIDFENSLYESALPLSSRRKRQLNFFWLGFFIYNASFTIPVIGFWTYSLENIFQLLGLAILFFPALGLIRLSFDSLYLKVFFFLYIIWTLVIILRGFHFLLDRNYLTPFLFDPYEGLFYLAPILLLFPRNFQFYRKLFDVIVLFGIAYLIFCAIFIKGILNPDVSSKESQRLIESFSPLGFSCGFILLTFYYHTKKRQFFALFVTFLTLLFAIYRARRGLSFMYVNMIFFASILYFFRTKGKVLIIVSIINVGLFASLYVLNNKKLANSGFLRNFTERVNEDTRTYVEEYFYADMKPNDWLIGKGLNGKYFCPGVEENEVYRGLIETGYLTTILKGGIISIALFLLIAIPAIIKGLIFSKNIFAKAAAIWIIMSMIDSYPGTTAGFVLSYLIVWISIAICYSKEIRNMSDETIADFLYPEYNLINETNEN